MALESFHIEISSRRLKQVAAHWKEASKGGVIPSFQQIKPSAIAAHLSIIWVYSFDAARDEFVGRIGGDQITTMIGKSLKGLRVGRDASQVNVPGLFEQARRVITQPALFQSRGLIFDHGDKISTGERIMMPLATDGSRCDGVLGASDFTTVARYSAEGTEAMKVTESWYTL